MSTTEAQQKSELHTQLWNIADTLRGKMNADEFRDYILGFIFYKYLSEKFEHYATSIMDDGRRYADVDDAETDVLEAVRDDAVDVIGYFLKPSELFSVLAKRGMKKTAENIIIGDLQTVLTNIEQSTMGTESSDDFIHLFEDIDLNSSKLGKTVLDRNAVIARVLNHLDEIDFKLEDTEADVLGDAYEYLIGQFASGAGKKAGEFYTPQKVSTLLAKLVTFEKKKLRNIYDPTCGSGSLLLRVKKEAESVGQIYGQEMNRTTYNLARMNLLLHDVSYADFDIKNEDTLKRPQHLDLRFDAVVANPPFSAKWEPDQLLMDDERFAPYGKLAPKSTADLAFVQHMVYQLSEEGTCAVVMPHGVLFRGSAELAIRKHLIEKMKVLDAVIGLPPNLFYGTGIPTCILVLKKCRKNDDIFFIDASAYFEKVKTQNYLRDEDIQRILDAYGKREDIDKFAHKASLDEIRQNDFNLNIPRYVDTFEAEEKIDLSAVSDEINQLETQMVDVDAQIRGFCQQLGIPVPFAERN